MISCSHPAWVAVLGLLAWSVCSVESSANSVFNSLFSTQAEDLFDRDAQIGIVAAFGDFNADERGDIFLITNNSRGVTVLQAKDEAPYQGKFLFSVNNSVIISVIPADYNGDAQLDIMIITEEPDGRNDSLQASIFWGNRTSVLPTPLVLPTKFESEPLVFDYNADMLPDLLAEPAGHPGLRKVWISNKNESFTVIDFPNATPDQSNVSDPFANDKSHAFIDLNNDLEADLVLTTTKGYEIWINKDGQFVLNNTRLFPEGLDRSRIGLMSFADLDSDQEMNQIVPACLDPDCTQSAIFIYNSSKRKWDMCLGPNGFNTSDQIWNFVPPDLNQYKAELKQSFPIAVRMGDFNLDGYSDGLALLHGRSETGEVIQQMFLFKNIDCSEKNCSFPRTFRLEQDDNYADVNKGVVLGTFYDIYDNGSPDIVMVSMIDANSGKVPHIDMMQNSVAKDDCFIKITVASGLCGDHCDDKNHPYGANYPGPTINFHTTKTDGRSQISYGTQLPQTSHFALQSPYQSFGLGPTPNFLDSLTVGIPTPEGEGHVREKSFPFIIPNSQLVVIPHPPDNPSSWKMKLYVTPSHAIYITGAALLGTCVFVAAITGILHWREKREDFLEKKQEAQRFHFDAM